jgi:hypothetical protein
VARFWGTTAVAVAICFLVAACAVVDQFDDRIYSGNLESQNALNNETLLNIVRASRYQSMNFIAITQVTGGLQETVSTGLPTITIGPAQTAAQHQFQVTNSISSQATGGFQSNPLVSTGFQSAMLSPVSPRIVALLSASHPREAVFYSLLDAIVLRDGNFIVRYENNETADPLDTHCSRLPGDYTRADLPVFEKYCNYDAFLELLHVLITAGLTSELLPLENVAQKDQPQASGHICFDRSRAIRGYVASPACGGTATPAVRIAPAKKASEPRDNVKDAGAAAGAKKAPTVQNTSVSAQRLTIEGVGTFSVTLSFRSPASVYRFYGTMYGQHDGGHYRYRATAYKDFTPDGAPFITITPDRTGGCYASANYEGQFFCAPRGAPNTALIFALLQELRNLSIQSTDLNSAFTVRLSN